MVNEKNNRRQFLQQFAVGTVASTLPAISQPAWGGRTLSDAFADFFQKHYQQMTAEEIQATLARIERKAEQQFGVKIQVENTPPIPNVVFGYAINITKCKGYRDCVNVCVQENNIDPVSQMPYIRVLQLDKGEMNLSQAEHYYHPTTVPVPGKYYLPVQCMQCEDPPCVKACPTKATWQEPDGIVVIDYDWCIGCRYCMAACPYWARHFNWQTPQLSATSLNPVIHYLGNRPRGRGIVEKCHFCIQRTRKGLQPACQSACPTGARIFGNLLDPTSDIRYVLAHKTVFRLKEDLGTAPKFWYFTD